MKTRWNCDKCWYKDECEKNLSQEDCDKFQQEMKNERLHEQCLADAQYDAFLDRQG